MELVRHGGDAGKRRSMRFGEKNVDFNNRAADFEDRC
jgi:hypothetical protein